MTNSMLASVQTVIWLVVAVSAGWLLLRDLRRGAQRDVWASLALVFVPAASSFVLPLGDASVFTPPVAFFVATPVLFAAALRTLGAPRDVVLWAGFLWCLFPPALRATFAGGQGPEIAFLVLSAVFGLGGLRSRGRLPAAILLVGSVCLAFQIRADAAALLWILPGVLFLLRPKENVGVRRHWNLSCLLVGVALAVGIAARLAVWHASLSPDASIRVAGGLAGSMVGWIPRPVDLDPVLQPWLNGTNVSIAVALLVWGGGVLAVRDRGGVAFGALLALVPAALLGARVAANGGLFPQDAVLLPGLLAVTLAGRGASFVGRTRWSATVLAALLVLSVVWTWQPLVPSWAIIGELARAPGEVAIHWAGTLSLYGAWAVVLWRGVETCLRFRPRSVDLQVVSLLALFAGAGLLRVLLATWGPGDFFVKQAGNFWPVYGLSFRGSAPATLFHLLFTVLPESDYTVVGVSLFLGALAPVFLVLFVRQIGMSRFAAFLSGVLLALHPVAVRYSGDQSRQMLALSLALLSLWSIARFRERVRWRQLVLAVCAAWLCFRSRPEAGVVLGYSWGLVVLVLPGSWSDVRERWFRRAAGALVFLSVVIGALIVWSSMNDGAVSESLSFAVDVEFSSLSPDVAVWLAAYYNPWSFVLLLGFGALAGFVRRPRWALWAVGCLLVATILQESFVGDAFKADLANARYQILTLPLAAMLVSFGVESVGDLWRRFLPWHLPRAGRALELALVALLVFGLIPRIAAVAEPRTVDREYAFVRQALSELPANARVYVAFPPKDDFQGGVQDPDAIAPIVGRRDLRWLSWPPKPEDGDGPAFYYRSPSCAVVRSDDPYGATSDGRFARCDDALGRVEPEPVLFVELEAYPYNLEVFAEDPIPVGFYRVRP